MDVVGLLFGREFVERVDDLAVVPLAVFLQVFRRAHDGDVQLAAARASLMVIVSLRPKKTERRWPSVFMLVKSPGSLT